MEAGSHILLGEFFNPQLAMSSDEAISSHAGCHTSSCHANIIQHSLFVSYTDLQQKSVACFVLWSYFRLMNLGLFRVICFSVKSCCADIILTCHKLSRYI